ncbi:hypothetical protein [Embleya sp. AB8]|uniref:hypothetical protein n=1 Tax=Embleya sp. AB8 TaxID=3156304 RepID=UPI003C7222AC
MPEHQVDAFFTITNAGPSAEQTGFVVQGDRAARFGWASGRMLDGALTLARRWPDLPTAFRTGFDAALTTPADDPWTIVFRGTQCLRLHPLAGTVAEVTTIAARFPGLPAGFASGIDAALPGTSANQAFFFRGNSCVLYDLRASAVVETKTLAAMWSGLQAKAPAFVNGISAATYDPRQGEFHFFRGSQFTKGVLATRTVTANAAAIDDSSWPGLVPTFSPGHAFVAVGRTVDVVDIGAGKVTATLDLDLHSDALHTLDITPDGRHLYAWTHRTRICLNTSTHQVVARLPEVAGEYAVSGLAFGPDGLLAHGLVASENHSRYYLDTFRCGTFERTRRIEVRYGDLLSGPGAGVDPKSLDVWGAPLEVAPSGRYLYFGTRLDGSGAVVEIDIEAGRVRQAFRIPRSWTVYDLTVSADGNYVHVGLGGDGVSIEGEVVTIDVRNGNIPLRGKLPATTALGLNANGGSLYCVPEDGKSGVLEANPADHSVRYRIPVGGEGGLGAPTGLSFDYARTYAFVGDNHWSTLSIIDTADHVMVRAIPLSSGAYPRCVAFTVY